MKNQREHQFPPQIETMGGRRFRYYGGGDEPPPATSSTTSQMVYSPEEEARRQQIFSAGSAIYEKQKGMWDSMINPGPKPVGASANTLQAQQMIQKAAMGSGQNLANNASSAVNFGLTGDVLRPDSNPALQSSIDAATRHIGNTYTDPGGVLSKIRGGFTGGSSGGTGTREGIASGIAGREYLNTVGDVTSSMSSDAYNKGLNFMSQSINQAPTAYNLEMQPGISMGAVGGQQEAYGQQAEDYAAANRQWQYTAPWQGLSPYANMVQGMSNPGQTTTGTATAAGAPGKNPMMGALSGAAMGFSIGGPWGAAAGGVLGLLGGI